MKILIFTEGGSGIGFGHVTRCVALYQALVKKGYEPLFIVNGDRSVNALLKRKKYIIYDWLNRKDRWLEFLKNADIAIIDSYLAGRDIYVKISKFAKTSVYFDDNKRLRYPRGILVNGSLYARKLKYPATKGRVYLVGKEYIAMRKEFWDAPKKRINKSVKNILVTFGGDDLRGMTAKVLKLLAIYYPALKKTVIIGKCFKNKDEIRRAKDSNTMFLYNPDAVEMKAVMLDSDIAVSAGGQTLYELARVGVPVVVVAVARNQLNNIKGWKSSGFIEYAGWYAHKNILTNIKHSLGRLSSYRIRISKNCIGRRTIDGKGANRICLNIINYAKYGQVIE